MERWRSIPDFNLYEVSSFGRIRSYATRHNVRVAEPRVLRTVIAGTQQKGRYLFIKLWRDHKPYFKSVHRLVLLAFVGPCPPGHESGHLDGNRQNAALENLRWVTKLENAAHRRLHGTHPQGEKNGHARLTEADVQSIRMLRRSQMSPRIIAQRFGIATVSVRHIVNRRLWSHVT